MRISLSKAAHLAVFIGLCYPPRGAVSSPCRDLRSAITSFRASRAESSKSSSGASSYEADSAVDIHSQISSCAIRSCLAFIAEKSALMEAGGGGKGMMPDFTWLIECWVIVCQSRL